MARMKRLLSEISDIFSNRRLRAIGRQGEYRRYALAELVTRLLYGRYRFSEFGRVHLEDEEFVADYERFTLDSYRSRCFERKYVIREFFKLARDLPGDTAECGAYGGHSSYVLCKAMQHSGKHHYVFDSFEGLSRPSVEDGTYWSPGDLAAPEERVRQNLSAFDFVRIYRGWIPGVFAQLPSDLRFCFLHLDVDLYEPTKDSLEFFYPRLNSGAVIVCDDYGFMTCPGARRAVDEFFSSRPEPVVLLPTGQSLTIKQ